MPPQVYVTYPYKVSMAMGHMTLDLNAWLDEQLTLLPYTMNVVSFAEQELEEYDVVGGFSEAVQEVGEGGGVEEFVTGCTMAAGVWLAVVCL